MNKLIACVVSMMMSGGVLAMTPQMEQLSVRHVISECMRSFNDAVEGICPADERYQEARTILRQELALLALLSGEAMPSQERLNYLPADYCYRVRKEIITNMILVRNIAPKDIHLTGMGVLDDAFLHRDFEFARLLLKKGATLKNPLAVSRNTPTRRVW